MAKQLLRLLNEEIRSVTVEAIGDVFSVPENLSLAKLKSRAFIDESRVLIRCLEQYKDSLIPVSSVILDICEVLLNVSPTDTKNRFVKVQYFADEISSLLLKLYEQSVEDRPDIANRCLDAWDVFFE